MGHVPTVLKSLDVEAQCRADSVNVFTVELLQDGGFASIVEAPAANLGVRNPCLSNHHGTITYNMSTRTSFSFCLIFFRMVSSPMVGVRTQPRNARLSSCYTARYPSELPATMSLDTLRPLKHALGKRLSSARLKTRRTVPSFGCLLGASAVRI